MGNCRDTRIHGFSNASSENRSYATAPALFGGPARSAEWTKRQKINGFGMREAPENAVFKIHEAPVSSGPRSAFPCFLWSPRAITLWNFVIALRIYLCLMISNCSGEWSFSKLRWVKNIQKNSFDCVCIHILRCGWTALHCLAWNTSFFVTLVNDFALLKSPRYCVKHNLRKIPPQDRESQALGTRLPPETINEIENNSKGKLKIRIWRHCVKITYSVLIKKKSLSLTLLT